uniref:hypothetical protein n=1 Tax=Eubacterium cellulosolvens TaxID=29322 RepID=UPI000482F35C|nr:hypothetical protein [[Eubacterium] cellulosolvens]
MAEKKGRRYTFIEKERFNDTKVSLILSVVSALTMGVCILISFIVQAKGDVALGAAGFAAALFAVYGFILGMKELSGNPEKQNLAMLAAGLSGVMMIAWIVLFLLGVSH